MEAKKRPYVFFSGAGLAQKKKARGRKNGNKRRRTDPSAPPPSLLSAPPVPTTSPGHVSFLSASSVIDDGHGGDNAVSGQPSILNDDCLLHLFHFLAPASLMSSSSSATLVSRSREDDGKDDNKGRSDDDDDDSSEVDDSDANFKRRDTKEGGSDVIVVARQLLIVRSVCRQWASLVASSNSLWRLLFDGLFGCAYDEEDQLRKEEKMELPDVWFRRFVEACRLMPRFVIPPRFIKIRRWYRETEASVKFDDSSDDDEGEMDEEKNHDKQAEERSQDVIGGSPKKAESDKEDEDDIDKDESEEEKENEDDDCDEEDEDEDDDEDEDAKEYMVETDCVEFAVVSYPYLSQKEISYRTHQLTALLAVFSQNGYEPLMSDLVLVGYRDRHYTIPLGRFCYAFLLRKDRKLLQELGFTSGDLATDSSKQRVALCPYMRDRLGNTAFVPFIYLRYRFTGKRLRVSSKYSLPRKFIKTNAHGFGQLEELSSAYQFITTKRRGWAPGFFNASFMWFMCATITTIYNHARKQIIVALAEEKLTPM